MQPHQIQEPQQQAFNFNLPKPPAPTDINKSFHLINNPREKLQFISSEHLSPNIYHRIFRLEVVESQQWGPKLTAILRINNEERRLFLSKSFSNPETTAALLHAFNTTGLYIAVKEIIRTAGSRIFTPVYLFKSVAEIRAMVESSKKGIDSNFVSGYQHPPTPPPSLVQSPTMPSMVRIDFFQIEWMKTKTNCIYFFR